MSNQEHTYCLCLFWVSYGSSISDFDEILVSGAYGDEMPVFVDLLFCKSAYICSFNDAIPCVHVCFLTSMFVCVACVGLIHG